MSLVDRVKNILLSPESEWTVVAAEHDDVSSLYVGYVLPLAAIPAVCGFIGMLRWLGFGGALTFGVETYLRSLVGVYLLGFIISKLAPRFGASEDLMGGLKVAAYSFTASWVGGVFLLLPRLGWLDGLAGLYGLYLLYVGLPIVIPIPASNTLTYVIVSIVLAVVVMVVLQAIMNALTPGVGMI